MVVIATSVGIFFEEDNTCYYIKTNNDSRKFNKKALNNIIRKETGVVLEKELFNRYTNKYDKRIISI